MATDKRLDQVSTLTDFDYALIVKGDQVAKASKQQLAELVGNLLYGATNASSLATVVAGIIGIAGKITSYMAIGGTLDLADARSLLFSVNATAGYDIGVHVVREDGQFVEIVPNTRFKYGQDADGYVCIYVSNKRIIVKNNTESNKRVYFNVISM